MSNFMNRCIVGYKFRFEPTAEQSRLLAQEFGCARFVYNHCLNKKKLSYKRRKEKLTYAQLSKHTVFFGFKQCVNIKIVTKSRH
jgi:transposase